MDKTAFVIPKGLRFEQTDQGIILEHEGDIILHEDLGSAIQKISSTKGDVHISIPLETTEILAPRGKIFTEHKLVANRLEAQIIHSKDSLYVTEYILTTGVLRVDGDIETTKLNAQGSVTIGGSAKIDHLTIEGELTISQDLACKQLYSSNKISIHQNCTSSNIETKGSHFECRGNLQTNTLIAEHASVNLQTSSEINILRANTVNIEGSSHKIKSIQAKDSVSISATSINSDVLFCKQIDISEETVGKIMVLEASNPPKAHRLKGCLQLVDLEDFIPNVDEFLQIKGIKKEFNYSDDEAFKKEHRITEHSVSVPLPSAKISLISKLDSDIIEETEEQVTIIGSQDHDQENDLSKSNNIEDKLKDDALDEKPLNNFFTSGVDRNIEKESLKEETVLQEKILDKKSINDSLLGEVRVNVQTMLDLYENPPKALVSLAEVLDGGDLYLFRDDLQHAWRNIMHFHQVSNVRYPENLALLFNKLNLKMSKLD